MKNDEPPLWQTVLKLLIGLIVIIGSVGLALWLALQEEQKNGPPSISVEKSWGVVNDNPVKQRR